MADDPGLRVIYNQKVVKYINEILVTYSNHNNTVVQNLDNAQSQVTNIRDRGDSLDTVKRDAEYYLKARAWTAEHKYKPVKIFYAGGWVLAAMTWNGIKYVVDPIFPSSTREKSGNPNSPPGGSDWAARGANDGLLDDGSKMGRARAVINTVNLD
jgi:hypothetical protein